MAIVGKMCHGTAQPPYSQRYILTARGTGESARFLSFDAPSDFTRASTASGERPAPLIRRKDAAARCVYVRMHGRNNPNDEELLCRSYIREDEFERNISELEREWGEASDRWLSRMTHTGNYKRPGSRSPPRTIE